MITLLSQRKTLADVKMPKSVFHFTNLLCNVFIQICFSLTSFNIPKLKRRLVKSLLCFYVVSKKTILRMKSLVMCIWFTFPLACNSGILIPYSEHIDFRPNIKFRHYGKKKVTNNLNMYI